MNLLVGRGFVLHFPSVWRRGWWGDEEQFACIWKREVLVFDFDRGRLAEVDSYSFAHDGFAIENLADANGGFFVEEGYDYTSEGFERCPRVDWRRGVNEVFDGLEVVGAKDLGILEVGD